MSDDKPKPGEPGSDEWFDVYFWDEWDAIQAAIAEDQILKSLRGEK